MKRTYLWLLILGLTSGLGCTGVSNGQNTSNKAQKMTGVASPTPTPLPTPTPNQGPRPYSKDLDKLRAQFNRDKGKVRLVILLSPT